jgi:hypothetical protein
VNPILTGILSLGSEWFKRRGEKQQAKHERDLAKLSHEQEWDITQAQNAGSSWKDEWFVIVLSIPMIGAFIPGMVPMIQEGFVVLSTMPDYYKAFLGSAIAASFGIKALSKWK